MSDKKPWLANYPEGVPAEIDPSQFPSIVAMLADVFKPENKNPAYTNFGKTMSYAEVDKLSRQFSNFLRAELGLKKGDRIAIMMPNLLQYPVAVLGALRAGLTVVNTNPLYTARELKHQLVDSGASAILVLENFAHVVEKVIGDVELKHILLTTIGDMLPAPKRLLMNLVLRHIKKAVPAYKLANTISFRTALDHGKKHDYEEVELRHQDIAFLQYTGGTTGVAKGAMLSHRNMVANILQAEAWLGSKLSEQKGTIITALPLYHIFALTANCLVFARYGWHNLLITNPRDCEGFVKTLSKAPFHAITGVNTLFNALLNQPAFADLDFSNLRLTLGGGMAVQPAVASRWKEMTGCPLLEAYGLTETSPAACINPMSNTDYSGSIGLPISSTECSIQDDDGAHLPVGEIGELCIRGPQVMEGYWQRPEETDKAITSRGWFHSGDMGYYDDQGYFYIVDRKKDMILVSGFNVYPNEVEDVVTRMDGVLEAAAIGVPDEKSGEAVMLCVVKKDPDLSDDEILEHCRENLTNYKIPRYIRYMDELPKTNVGKILRRELREKIRSA